MILGSPFTHPKPPGGGCTVGGPMRRTLSNLLASPFQPTSTQPTSRATPNCQPQALAASKDDGDDAAQAWLKAQKKKLVGRLGRLGRSVVGLVGCV
jgi:hypothetical protein